MSDRLASCRSAGWTGLLWGVCWSASAFAQASPSDFTSGTRYDLQHRITGTIAPDPDGTGPLHHAAVRNTYDAAGRLTRVEKGELATWQSEAVASSAWTGFTVQIQVDMTYDSMDRKLTEATSSGGTTYTLTQYSYDNMGRLECTAVRMNPAAFGSLPASACTLGTQGTGANDFGPDRITRNSYDPAGQLLKVQKGYGTSLVQDYVTYAYSPNGKRTQVIDANGALAKMTYDGFDRLDRWYMPSPTAVGSASTTDYEQYGYDPNSNRTSWRKRDGRTFTYAYDALNRMTQKIVPDGCAPIGGGACPAATATRDVYYSYDLQGHQTAARFDSATGADAVTSTYDGFGRLTGTITAMGGTSASTGYGYDADGNRTLFSTTPINPQPSAGSTWNYVYDGLNRMVGLYEGTGTSTVLSTWTYNSRGLQASVAERYGATASWSYDGIGRLSSQTDTFVGGTTSNVTTTLGYNPAGQIATRSASNDLYAFPGYTNLSRTYATNGLNQYTTAGPATFTYDANGNLTGDGTSSFGYDAENRLVTNAAGVTLDYDPLGRLWRVSGGGQSTTRFLYDGDQLVREFDTNGNTVTRYVHGSGEDDPLVWYDAGWAKWYHRDHHGSIIALANGPQGALINSYDEYGIPASGNTGRFQYTGQVWMPEIGMSYYKARMYSPTLGRFLQTDPVGYDDQINLYAYVANDPVNHADPSGMFGCGSELKGAACDQFKADQAAAAKQLTTAVKTVRSLASDLAAGRKLSGAERSMQASINKYQGAGTGSDVKFLGKFAAEGDKIIGALNSDFPVQPHSQTGTDYASAPAGLVKTGPVNIFPNYYNQSTNTRRETWPHEGAHFALGARDWAYGSAAAARLARDRPNYAQNSADNIALGFGFDRDD